MKHLITLFAILITFSVNAQWSFQTVGPGTTLTGIISTGASSYNNRAIGDYAIAMGHSNISDGDYSIAMGYYSYSNGNYSNAIGYNNTSNGLFSIAMGRVTFANGYASTTMGRGTIASGDYSTAAGYFTTAEDYGTFSIGQYNTADTSPNPETFDLTNRAFVIGNGVDDSNKSDAMTVLFDGTTTIAGSVTASSFIGDGSGLTNVPGSFWAINTTSTTGIESPTNTASGDNSIALGYITEASGDVSTAMGAGTTASGIFSIAMGAGTFASGSASTAMGSGTNASGVSSTATGYFTTAEDYGTFSIGQYNTADTSPNPETFDLANTAFVIGNGSNASNKSDAMTVLFDGTTTIAGDLTINSDARLKSNIISLGGTLYKLLALDGKSYTFKSDESKQKIGLLAQDVQDVFPELVKEASDEQGTLSVNYQGLIPVLINAIKEQQTEIQVLKQQVKALQKD